MRREILSTYCIGMSGRLIFTRQTKQNVDNHYVVGAGVGAKTTSVRRALKRRANNSQKEGPNGEKVWAPCVGFCPTSPGTRGGYRPHGDVATKTGGAPAGGLAGEYQGAPA